eukprot:9448965-Alexandrium_andersonii.AAC.1
MKPSPGPERFGSCASPRSCAGCSSRRRGAQKHLSAFRARRPGPWPRLGRGDLGHVGEASRAEAPGL